MKLIRDEYLDVNDLELVIDLGSYQGSSTMALKDVGARKVISVDQNDLALQNGLQTGYIDQAIHSDMSKFMEDLRDEFSGTITAFNCILYLKPDSIKQMIDNMSEKMTSGSKCLFIFSKTQSAWAALFPKVFGSSFSTRVITGLSLGELDHFCVVATKK